MIDRRTIFEIHRLRNEGYPKKQVARKLGLTRKTVRKYLAHPEGSIKKRASRVSKLGPYKDMIDQFLEKDPEVKAPVILQHLQASGFEGKITILRDYLQKKRGRTKKRQPFIRFESPPGKQMQIDWGHFGSLTYDDTPRKLYALVLVESFSRMLYVHFTHSQKQAALHQGLLQGFTYLGGTPDELVVDNMASAVIERDGPLIRFNDAFLDFLRPLKIVPRACSPGAPYEKGKVERTIQYVRRNFWPLRSFQNLDDVQKQLRDWIDTVANVRIHQTTGQKPIARFKQVVLGTLPDPLPDCRETRSVLVHKDFAVRFDGNAYTAPPWTVGKTLTLKAGQSTVTIYLREKRVAVHPRSWKRKERVELPAHKEMVKKIQKKLWHSRDVAIFASLGRQARDYLDALARAQLPIKKNVSKLLALKDQYGTPSLFFALQKAFKHHAMGAEYIENILYQEMTPQNIQPPVKLKDEALTVNLF